MFPNLPPTRILVREGDFSLESLWLIYEPFARISLLFLVAFTLVRQSFSKRCTIIESTQEHYFLILIVILDAALDWLLTGFRTGSLPARASTSNFASSASDFAILCHFRAIFTALQVSQTRRSRVSRRQPFASSFLQRRPQAKIPKLQKFVHFYFCVQRILSKLTHSPEESDLQYDSIHGKKHSKSHVQADSEQRTKRKYIKKSSKWKTLSQSSQLREENFLRAPNQDGAIRPTATRYDASRYCRLPHFVLMLCSADSLPVNSLTERMYTPLHISRARTEAFKCHQLCPAIITWLTWAYRLGTCLPIPCTRTPIWSPNICECRLWFV